MRGVPSVGTGAPSPNDVVRNAIDQTYGVAAKAIANPALSFTETPRSQTQNQLFSGLVTDYTNTEPTKQKSLADFTKEFLSTNPMRTDALRQEAGSIDDVYSGRLASDLDTLLAQRRGAVNVATNKALDRARLENQFARLNAGGAGSSYLDRAYSGQAGDIMAGEAVNEANLARDNAQYVQGQKTNLLGQRENLARNYLLDQFLPIEKINQAQSMDIGNVQGLANLENANNVYETPEEALARRIGLVGSLQNLSQMRGSFDTPNVPALGPYTAGGSMVSRPLVPGTTIPTVDNPAVFPKDIRVMTPEERNRYLGKYIPMFFQDARAKGYLKPGETGQLAPNFGDLSAPFVQINPRNLGIFDSQGRKIG